MAKAKVDLQFLENACRLLKTAVSRTGMTITEAMDALGIKDQSQYNRMLEGKEKLWMHQLLRPEAKRIRREIWVLDAQECGCTVERVVRIVETA